MAESPREVSGEVQPAEDSGQAGTESRQLITLAQVSGPLPPPAVLQGYDDVLPGAAERIMKMAESEQQQRHSFDNVLAASVTRQQERGQRFAFILGGGALALAAYMVHAGHPGYAIVTTISSIATLAAALMYRRKAKAKPEPKSNDS